MSAPWRGAQRPLSPQAFRQTAADLGCEEAALRAVWEVEAAGRFWSGDGVIRRFEPHKMPREHWSLLGFHPGNAAPWRASLKLGQSEREMMFRRACTIDQEAALRASSWGAPQIMGFNAEDAGYGSAEAMVRRMAGAEDAHLRAFAALVRSWGLDAALRAHDWYSFARRYNGSGQPEVYARKIEAAYRRHSGGQRSPEVLRVGDRGPAVRRLQQALGVDVDGAFGPETELAVRQFQRENDLRADGLVGAKTWAALEPLIDKPVPKQPTKLDDVLARGRDVAATVGAGTAAATPILDRLSDNAVTIMVAVAGIAALMALGAHLFLSKRRKIAWPF